MYILHMVKVTASLHVSSYELFTCISLYTHHHNQDIEQLYHSKKFLKLPLYRRSLCCPQSLALIDLLSIPNDVFLRISHRLSPTPCNLLRLESLTEHNALEIIQVVICTNSSFYFLSIITHLDKTQFASSFTY